MGGTQPALIIKRDGPVAIIMIYDAPYNRMTLDFRDQLEELIPELEQGQRVRSIVIRGAD